MSEEKKIKAGDLYKVIAVAGREFEIRYIDFGEHDPECKGEFIPDFPFFDEKPEYTEDRYPFTNRLNDCCEHYRTEDATPDNTCHDCVYFQDAVEEIAICCCTARRLRENPTMSGKPIKVSVIGNLPTAEKVVRECYKDVIITNYERGTDFALVPTVYDLVLVKSNDGEGLGVMGLTCNYNASGESVTVPVRLLDEPLSRSAEAELATLIKCEIVKMVNN